MDIYDKDWAVIFLIIIDMLVMLTNSSWTNTTSELETNHFPNKLWLIVHSAIIFSPLGHGAMNQLFIRNKLGCQYNKKITSYLLLESSAIVHH